VGVCRVCGTIIHLRLRWDVSFKSFSRRRGWPPPIPPHKGEGVSYDCQDAFHVLVDVAVPETKDAISFRFQKRRTVGIVSHPGACSVLAAINLNNQLGMMPCKISSVRSHRYLFAKMCVRETLAQRLPLLLHIPAQGIPRSRSAAK
jgi:hypothetical protein